METSIKFKTVEEYMRLIPEQSVERAEEIRALIKQAAPKAEEVISYNMPAYKLDGILVYFAAYKAHIGFYPAGRVEAFADQLTGYKTSKGTIQFPLDKPIPKTLVKNIVKSRIAENKEKAALKKVKKK